MLGNEHGIEMEKEVTSQGIVEIHQQFEALTLQKMYLDIFISFCGCFNYHKLDGLKQGCIGSVGHIRATKSFGLALPKN